MKDNRANTMIRSLTEAYMRKKIKELKDDPERGVRNLIDLALNLSTGRFQKNFFTIAQTMLQNPQSSYYKLIQDVISRSDEERLVTFGINVGYNSLTFGARYIREDETAGGFNIPWSISLCTSETTCKKMESSYYSLIEQGINLGIYSWIFYAKSGVEQLLPLIKAYPDCAFLLILSTGEVTEEFLDGSDPLHNLMLCVRYDTGSSDVCAKMRKRKMLYSFCIAYHPQSTTVPQFHNLLSGINELHPVFTIFMPDSPVKERAAFVYDQILTLRKSQQYATIPLELYYDLQLIDRIISNDECVLSFDENGTILKEYSTSSIDHMDFCSMPLLSILKRGYQKAPRSQASID